MTAVVALGLATAVSGMPPPPPRLATVIDRAIDMPYDGGAPFFPTGRRLWVTHPQDWGFPGDVHFIHAQGGAAFAVDVRWNGADVKPVAGRVRASRLELEGRLPGLEVKESKLLSADDVLVSVLRLRAGAGGDLEVSATSPLAATPAAAESFTGEETFHGQRLRMSFHGPKGSRGETGFAVRRTLAAGEEVKIRFAFAVAPEVAAAATASARVMADPDPVATEARATERWFAEGAPLFDCPDDFFTHAFAYRLLVVKKALLDPKAGFLLEPAVAEGRWAATWYPSVITFGAGHQLAEMRWLRDPALAWGHLGNFVRNQREDGAFRGARVDELLSEYTDFIALGAHDLYLATGDRARFAAVAPALARNADYVLTRDADKDFLPEPRDHWETGMEWQPSFFAFSGYDTTREAKLERVEYACYLHAGALAAARALELAGKDGARHRDLAARVARAVEERMWDDEARFYLALRFPDHAKAPDREVVGFYPAAFAITPDARLDYLKCADDPKRWASPFAVPSVEMASPAWSGVKTWPVGPGGSASMWNGPVWPHSLSFVARALARGERAGALAPGTTYKLLRSYTRAHFFGMGEARALDRPVVGEMYHPINGAWLTNERDYFHSTYVDLVVTLLAGVIPAEGDELVVSPLVPPGTWDRFAISRVPYHGRDLAVAWDAPGGEDAYGDGIDGLAVWVDGRLAARRDGLGPLKVSLGPE